MAINLLLLLTWGASIWFSWKLYRDLFTPLCLYASVWCICLLLFRLRLVLYYQLSRTTVLLIAGSIAGFAAGCFTARRRLRVIKGSSLSRPAIRWTRLEAAIKLMLILNLSGELLFTWHMSRTYGLATYPPFNLLRFPYTVVALLAFLLAAPLGFVRVAAASAVIWIAFGTSWERRGLVVLAIGNYFLLAWLLLVNKSNKPRNSGALRMLTSQSAS